MARKPYLYNPRWKQENPRDQLLIILGAIRGHVDNIVNGVSRPGDLGWKTEHLFDDVETLAALMPTEWSEVNEFQRTVLYALPPITNPRDLKVVTDGIAELHRQGYTLEDAIIFCKALEEVNPELSEEEGLAVIAQLAEKYK